jgi:hypothetical protein
MKPFASRTCLALVSLLLGSPLAHAQAFRAYVASYGSDANPCTIGAPCRLLPAAINAVVSDGEVWMLDSANFNAGTVSVTKSVSIMAVPGEVGSIVAFNGGAAIVMSTPGITVNLRNVVITNNAANPGTDGIVIAAGTLNVEDSLISNLQGAGIKASGTSTFVNITGTVLRNILTFGYAILATSGPTVNVSKSQLLNTAGIRAQGDVASTTTSIVFADSEISGGQLEGLYATATAAGAIAKVLCERSSIQGAYWALDSETNGLGSAVVAAAYCTVSNNHYGIYQSGVGSVVKSYGNNHIGDNVTESGALTTAALR